jgi:ectoine hydroxylase-related dioxygenase (phytanoyl-CoA dioxygenase family)
MPERIECYLRQIAEQGFAVIPGVFSPGDVERMRAAIEEVFACEEGALAGHGPHVRFSVNLTNKHAVFRETIQQPFLMELMAALLGDDFILGSLHTRSTYPGAPAQQLHRDWMLDRRIPFPTHVNSMWMLDDFTAENGATRLVPGSHLWDGEPEAQKVYPGEVQATGAAGSVAVFDSRVYHAGGANRSGNARRGLTGFFCRSWAKPQEDHTRSIDRVQLADASPLLIRLWGFHAQVPWEEPDQPNVMKQVPAPGVPATLPA